FQMNDEITLIDALVDGRVDRREFLVNATALGLSTAMIGAVLGTSGAAASPFVSSRTNSIQGEPGGTLVFGAW
ncbi:MAG: hypothetical protein M3440_09710, partial [Chloroflexota bacterium]|nr:hypothetical protein [Chloroflexota bacterium]